MMQSYNNCGFQIEREWLKRKRWNEQGSKIFLCFITINKRFSIRNNMTFMENVKGILQPKSR